MNWFTPIVAPRRRFRVTIGSDWAPIWSYEDVMRKDAASVYGDLLPLFLESNLNIVNLECVLGNRGAPIPKAGPALCGEAQTGIAGLKAAKIGVVTLANNHSMDHGPESLEETLRLLCEAGISPVGAGMTGEAAAKPLLLTRGPGEAPLAIINCGEGEACASLDGGPGANVYNLRVQEKQIADLRDAGYLVITIFHGGREHAVMPPPYVVHGLRALAEAGSAAVIAHHPHVPQGVEIHQGVPIAYSQGNFIFRRGTPHYYLNIGYLVHLDIGSRKVEAVAMTPYRMEPEGTKVLAGEERAAFLKDLKELSGYLSDPKAVESFWNAFADLYGKGEESLYDQLRSAVQRLEEDRPTALSYWHHYFFAPAHREYFSDGLKRLRLGTFGDSPEWAREWVRKWKEREQ